MPRFALRKVLQAFEEKLISEVAEKEEAEKWEEKTMKNQAPVK